MRMKMLHRWFVSGAAALAALASAGGANAAPTTEESGSIIIFPKVLGTADRDTLIQISNTGNNTAYAHCFYVNAGVPGRWIATDFQIFLTKQQPTQWMARSGRAVNFLEPFASPGSGIDPGLIPPVPLGFQGELRCVQVDGDLGAPLRANQLKGNATIVRIGDGDASKYNAIAVPGNPNLGVGTNDSELLFDHTPTHAGEYHACPDTLTVNVLSTKPNDPIIADLTGDCLDPGDCPIDTWLTFVPCSQDLERLRPGVSTISIDVWDEFESMFSRSIEVDCWFNASLRDPIFQSVFNRDTLGVHARFNPAPGSGGILGVGEELRTDFSENSTWAAFNLHHEGNRFDKAANVRGEQLTTLRCAGGTSAGTPCTNSAQCPGGTCVNGVLDKMVLPRLP